jgi:hypothetical protein
VIIKQGRSVGRRLGEPPCILAANYHQTESMTTPKNTPVEMDGLSTYSSQLTSVSTTSELSDFGDGELSAAIGEAASSSNVNQPASLDGLERHSIFGAHEDMCDIRVRLLIPSICALC